MILDEPTSGLDPHSQWEVRQIVKALHKQGKTILICSHYLTEVEALCNRVCILRKGKTILSGSVADLLHSQGIVEIVLGHEQEANVVAERLSLQDEIIEAHGNILRIAEKSQQHVLSALVNAQVLILSLSPVSQTLEEVYVRTTRATIVDDVMQVEEVTTGKGGKV